MYMTVSYVHICVGASVADSAISDEKNRAACNITDTSAEPTGSHYGPSAAGGVRHATGWPLHFSFHYKPWHKALEGLSLLLLPSPWSMQVKTMAVENPFKMKSCFADSQVSPVSSSQVTHVHFNPVLSLLMVRPRGQRTQQQVFLLGHYRYYNVTVLQPLGKSLFDVGIFKSKPGVTHKQRRLIERFLDKPPEFGFKYWWLKYANVNEAYRWVHLAAVVLEGPTWPLHPKTALKKTLVNHFLTRLPPFLTRPILVF